MVKVLKSGWNKVLFDLTELDEVGWQPVFDHTPAFNEQDKTFLQVMWNDFLQFGILPVLSRLSQQGISNTNTTNMKRVILSRNETDYLVVLRYVYLKLIMFS